MTAEQLEELRAFDTPTVSNAIELFGVRPRTEGFMGPEIKCIIPIDKPMVGYACTGRMSSGAPPIAEQQDPWRAFFSSARETPSPTIAVIQDMDPSSVGSLWGEVNVSSAKAMGCVGVVTNGGVRDVTDVARLDFGYFAGCVLVSHAWDHLEAVGGPVEVGGLTVNPGDLLHADRHGVLVVPLEIAGGLADACRQVQSAEKVVMKGCREAGYDVDVEQLMKWREEMTRRRSLG